MKNSRVTLGIIVLLIISCGVFTPSEEKIKEKFEKEVTISNSCSTDEECVIVHPGCPLGCNVAVNIEHQQKIKNLAKSLIKDYEFGSKSCAYSCIPRFPVCVIDKCETSE